MACWVLLPGVDAAAVPARGIPVAEEQLKRDVLGRNNVCVTTTSVCCICVLSDVKHKLHSVLAGYWQPIQCPQVLFAQLLHHLDKKHTALGPSAAECGICLEVICSTWVCNMCASLQDLKLTLCLRANKQDAM